MAIASAGGGKANTDEGGSGTGGPGRIELPDGPRESFAAVEPVLREFFGASGYRMGGGTVLAALWRHRHSTDVDFFAEPAWYREVVGPAGRELERALLRIPGANAERSWVEPEQIVLDLPTGEATVIPAARLFPEIPFAGVIGTTAVPAEGVEEILAKKIGLRMLGAGSYLIRDLYDVALAGRRAPDALGRVLAAEGSRRLRQVAAELSTLDDFEGELIRPAWAGTPGEIRDEVVARCLRAAESAEGAIRGA